MQLGLIIGIAFAIVATLFAMQNFAPVTVALGLWDFEGSLALVLLVTLGLGALIAGLVSSPAMIRRQWAAASLRRQVLELERKLAEEARRNAELRTELARAGVASGDLPAEPAPAKDKPYVGLRTLITGGDTREKQA